MRASGLPRSKCVALFALVLAPLWVAVASDRARAACKDKGRRPQVMVKAKTPLRRGPGLNYPVSQFIEEGRCFLLGEVSLDEQWVLVEDETTKLLGWVPLSQIDGASREKLPGAKADAGPIGSGQVRGYVTSQASQGLLMRPDPDSERRKLLPQGERLLPLAMTEDEMWIEVRDSRGETGWVSARGVKDEIGILATLPRANAGLETGLTGASDAGRKAGPESTHGRAAAGDPKRAGRSRWAPPAPPATGEGTGDDAQASRPRIVPEDRDPMLEPEPPMGTDLEIDAALFAVAALPRNALDSNGTLGIRRYALRAFAAGAHLEAIAAPIGAFRARLGYGFVFLSGLESPEAPGQSIGGQEHDVRILFGYPIDLGTVRLIPELGYAFALFAIEPSLPSAGVPQFFSSHSHGLNAGGVASIVLAEGFALDIEGALLAGTTIEYPFDLGGAGLTLGLRGGAGLRFGLAEGADLVGRWDIRYRKAPFRGTSLLDSTITSAELEHLENGFALGLALAL